MWRLFIFLSIASVALAAGPGQSVPVFYIPNHGQAPPEVRFMAKGSGLTAYFLPREILFGLHGRWVHMRFEGAAAAPRIEGSNPLPGRANFLNGPERQWHRDEPTFAAVRYRALYPGIDMVYGESGRQLKSEFVVAPGTDPCRIRIRYAGAGKPSVQPDESLVIPLGDRQLTEAAPYVYQERDGSAVKVRCRYRVARNGTVGFEVGVYDPRLPLIIDPIMGYSTLLGASSFNAATAIAVDSSGAAYIAGYTDSYNLPTVNPEQVTSGGGNDAFVAKLNPAGSAVEYCTYLGGAGDDRAYGIAVDSSGEAYVTGYTTSSNFPTASPLQSSLNGGRNVFISKLSAAGNTLLFSTYLGGSGSDTAYGIALDTSGNAYVVGDTTSPNFPASAFQSSNHGSQDAFVSKISSSGNQLVYSTYLGGSGTDHGAAIAVDASGEVSVTGYTWSLDFPMYKPMQGSIGGGCDAFVTRLGSNGNSLLFSTYFGGSNGSVAYPEAGTGVAVDSQGDTYVAGVTSSSNFPLTKAVQPELLGFTDAFIAKFNSNGLVLYSTYLGGAGVEIGNAIAVDSSGAAYVAGYTYSTDFPVTAGAIQAALGGDCDAFLVKMSPTGDSLLYATYLGGSGSDTASGVALDPSGNVFLAGWTESTNFPVQSSGT